MKSFASGIIGAVISVIAMWLVFGVFDVPLNMPNVYIGVAIAGFFSAFFALLCSTKCCLINKVTPKNAE